MLSNAWNYFEQNIIVQYLATFLCSFQTLITSFISKLSNNKYVVGTIVIILGSIYPLILKYTKNGQSKYPFMIGVAVCLKNVLMLIYYWARYLTFLYSQYTHKVYNYQYIDPENTSDPNSYTYSSQHHLLADNTSHYAHNALSNRHTNESTLDHSLDYIPNTRHSQSSAMINILSSTPNKLQWALSVLKSPDKRHRSSSIEKAKTSSLSLHELAKRQSEIACLAANDDNDDEIHSKHVQTLEMEAISLNDEHDTIYREDSIASISSKQIKMDKCNECFSICPPLEDIKHRLKLYCYLAPNALLVLMNDILALYTLTFVSVATYAVFMQVTILFIVIVRYFCLNKSIKSSQLLSVCISVFGMIVFELVELEPKILDQNQSVLSDENAKSDMIGIGLCMVRGIFKACDLVYVEWFIHHLNEIPFYEKQAVVSVWFVICSFLYVVLYHGNDLFIQHRYLFDGFNDITWLFVGYGTFFALMIYLLILRLDSMVMGFCQQMTVLFAVSLDVIFFHTKVTAAMWFAALIVVVAIIQYSVIQYEHLDVVKHNEERKRMQEEKPLVEKRKKGKKSKKPKEANVVNQNSNDSFLSDITLTTDNDSNNININESRNSSD